MDDGANLRKTSVLGDTQLHVDKTTAFSAGDLPLSRQRGDERLGNSGGGGGSSGNISTRHKVAESSNITFHLGAFTLHTNAALSLL